MKKFILLAVAALTFGAAVSEAYITPGPRPPRYPDDGYGPGRPGQPPRPPGRPGPGPGRPGPGYPGNPGYPPGQGSYSVPVYVNARLYNNDRLDITRYIDMNRYRGYRLVAIDVTASAVYNSALMDILINSFNVGPTFQLGRYQQSYRAYPQGDVRLGYGADSIMIYSRGDMDVRDVVLQLAY